ncbi:purple acid phosphatase family protein [Dyadobacter tibetensis]|uniref:purple acid phosphatase family protein n=1 Tax=Dyadobacter tibetensis TaxID=1211851 RepID=UPI001E463C03|nr:metallophosphoesterase family protein [Dyadobacter tibetensis]
MKTIQPAKLFYVLALLSLAVPSCKPSQNSSSRSVKNVIDEVVTRFYNDFTPAQLDTIGQDFIVEYLSQEDREVLSTGYQTFEVNVPVTVSLMRDKEQKVVPFWLERAGFKRTEMVVTNEHSTYEVWQKDFDKGPVRLGINGFDKHRPVYFICIGPKDPSERLEISQVVPEKYSIEVMRKGAFTYHDWDSLILEEVPPSLEGQMLFTTVRGRAREAHLVGAFRNTVSVSSEMPDQLLQTWSGDPTTTMNIQWRTNDKVPAGMLRYWIEGQQDTLQTEASLFKMEDRLLQNDRYVHRFTAKLKDLHPGKTYHYRAGSVNGKWSEVATFSTEPDVEAGFSYVWFGDTHYSPVWGDMIQKVHKRHPEVAFYSIAGDLVSTGLHRNEWDEFWKNSGNVFQYKPLMPVPGNHDSQDGLGSWMYEELFSLPENGPVGVPKEVTYALEYQNALYLQIDGTQPVDEQTAWIEEKLKNSKATWKFAMFHFPPYNFVEPYDEIREKWCSLFDKYHVDMVMSGHMHYYLRTKPMFNNQVAANPSQGTIYLMSISIPGKQDEWLDEDYAVVRYPDGPLYQHMAIKGNTLTYRAMDPDGNVKDQLVIKK